MKFRFDGRCVRTDGTNKSREANRLSYTSRAIVREHYNTVSSSRDIGNDLVFPHLQASLCVCRS